MADIFDAIKFTDEVGFFSPPVMATRNASGITPGEIKWESSTKSLLLGNTATTWDEVIVSLSNGSGIVLTGSGGRYSIALDSSVVRTTGNQNISGVKRFNHINLSSAVAVLRIPQDNALPAIDLDDGRLFWKKDTKELYVYSATSAAWELAGTTLPVTLTATPGLEFDSTDLQVKVDAVSTGDIAPVVDRNANGIAVRVDDDTIKHNGSQLILGQVYESNMDASAKQTTLESKVVTQILKLPAILVASNTPVLDVTGEVRSLATLDANATLFSEEGVFTGYVEDARLMVRSLETKSVIGFNNFPVYARLSNRMYIGQTDVIPGIEIKGIGPNAIDVNEVTNAGGNLMQWNGGSPVDIGDYLYVQGAVPGDYVILNGSVSAPWSSFQVLAGAYMPAAPLTNITGVQILGILSPGGSFSGFLSLRYTGPTPFLVWLEGDGTPVDVSVDGEYVLDGGNGNYMRVAVTTASLPLTDQDDTVLLSTSYQLHLFTEDEFSPIPYISSDIYGIDVALLENVNLFDADFSKSSPIYFAFNEQYRSNSVATSAIVGDEAKVPYLDQYNNISPSLLYFIEANGRFGFNNSSPQAPVDIYGNVLIFAEDGNTDTIFVMQNNATDDGTHFIKLNRGDSHTLVSVDKLGNITTDETLTVGKYIGIASTSPAPSAVANTGVQYVSDVDGKLYYLQPTSGTAMILPQKYVHTQGSSNTSWVIAHNLNSTNLQIFARDGSNNHLFDYAITYTDANNITLTHGASVSGQAVVIG